MLRPGEYSDTYYYFLQIEKAKQIGGSLATIFPEYPTPAAWLLMLPSWLGAEGYEGYRAGFLVLVTLFAAFTALLIARTGPIGVAGWVLLITSPDGSPCSVRHRPRGARRGGRPAAVGASLRRRRPRGRRRDRAQGLAPPCCSP